MFAGVRGLRRVVVATLAALGLAAAAPAGASATIGWLDGAHTYQYFSNCFGGQGWVESYTGYWGDTDGSYPVVGDAYLGHIVVAVVGNPCAGGDFAATDIVLPSSTNFNFDPNDDWGHVRCFYTDGLSGTGGEVTNDPDAHCTQNPGGGYSGYGKSLGGRDIASYHTFEVIFPLKSTQQLSASKMTAPITTGIATCNFTDYRDCWPAQLVWVSQPATTTINSGPSGTTGQTSASFTFSANKTIDHFECRLDSQAYSSCTSPKGYSGLSNGSHTFYVRAIGLGGGAGNPATRTWTVSTGGGSGGDITAPETSITSGPSGTTSDSTPTFAFASSEPGSTFQCRLDNTSYAACTSPMTLGPLAAGPHSFDVRATDPAGNTDVTPATRAFTVDTSGGVDTNAPTASAPVQSLVQGAQLGTSTVPVRFTWSASDNVSPASSIQSFLQQRTKSGSTWSAYSSLVGPTLAKTATPALPANPAFRQFRVRPQDQAGNLGTGPAGPQFRVFPYQESNGAIAYSGKWHQTAKSGAFGGSVRYSTQAGAKATLTSTARNVAAVMPLTPTGGKAKICLDPGTAAQSCSTVDLSPPGGLGARKEVFVRNGLNATKTHKIQVTVVSGRVDLDAFVALR